MRIAPTLEMLFQLNAILLLALGIGDHFELCPVGPVQEQSVRQ